MAWEYRLFFQAWHDEVDSRRDLFAAYEARLRHGVAENVGLSAAVDWLQTLTHEFQGLIDSANHVINVSAQQAFGPPGTPGDPALIVRTAAQIGDLFETAIRWAQRIERVRIAPPFDEVTPHMARLPDQTISRLRAFPIEALQQIEADIREASTERPIKRNLSLVLELSNLQPYMDAMARARQRLEAGEF